MFAYELGYEGSYEGELKIVLFDLTLKPKYLLPIYWYQPVFYRMSLILYQTFCENHLVLITTDTLKKFKYAGVIKFEVTD